LSATFTPAAKGKASSADRFAMVSARRSGENLEVVIQNTFKQGEVAQKNRITHAFVPSR
jgi:hypothetical protein